MTVVLIADADGVHRKRQKIANEGLNFDCIGSSSMFDSIVPLYMPGELAVPFV